MMSPQATELENVADHPSENNSHVATRTVSLGLFALITILPFIGAFFTLRKGYSHKTRAVAFGWLVLVIAIKASNANHPVQAESNNAESGGQAVVQDPVVTYAEYLEQSSNPSCVTLGRAIKEMAVNPYNYPNQDGLNINIAFARKNCD